MLSLWERETVATRHITTFTMQKGSSVQHQHTNCLNCIFFYLNYFCMKLNQPILCSVIHDFFLLIFTWCLISGWLHSGYQPACIWPATKAEGHRLCKWWGVGSHTGHPKTMGSQTNTYAPTSGKKPLWNNVGINVFLLWVFFFFFSKCEYN